MGSSGGDETSGRGSPSESCDGRDDCGDDRGCGEEEEVVHVCGGECKDPVSEEVLHCHPTTVDGLKGDLMRCARGIRDKM